MLRLAPDIPSGGEGGGDQDGGQFSKYAQGSCVLRGLGVSYRTESKPWTRLLG